RAPPAGSYISVGARLSPPLQPLRPGGYDFARDLYFHGIGASGFAAGAIALQPPPEERGLRLRFASFVEGIRATVDARIRATIPRHTRAAAPALLTGKRHPLASDLNPAMEVVRICHVLSI